MTSGTAMTLMHHATATASGFTSQRSSTMTILSEETQMTAQKLLALLMFAAVMLPLHARAGGHHEDGQIEPNAGNWATWVISSGRDYRVPPPPGAADTQAELRVLADLISRNDAQTRQQIEFWDAGAPAYRWIDLINGRAMAGAPLTSYP